jgi:hypothetical protein
MLGTIAVGYVWDVTDVCNAVAAGINSVMSTYMGAAGYLHSTISGTPNRSFSIPGSTTGAFKQEGPIATTPTSEIPGCPWTGPHLHQFSDVSGWFRNSNVYVDEATPARSGWALSDEDNWQNRRPWSE